MRSGTGPDYDRNKNVGLPTSFLIKLKTGQTVRHKLSGDILTVVSISETVARCRRQTPILSKWLGMEIEIWGAVCLIENLEPIEQQLTLFTP